MGPAKGQNRRTDDATRRYDPRVRVAHAEGVPAITSPSAQARSCAAAPSADVDLVRLHTETEGGVTRRCSQSARVRVFHEESPHQERREKKFI